MCSYIIHSLFVHHVTLVAIVITTQMAVAEERIVGFDCEFVEDPPKYLQTECPVCLLILRDPYQVTCCGKSFCRECTERVKADQKPCPCCKQEVFNDFPNKGLQQPLYGFQVRCSNKDEGCKWTGELGQLDRHLNLNSVTMETELEGCQYAKVKCSFCAETITRNRLHHHKSELCNKRPFSCEHCNEYESTYGDVINNHWPVCGCHPVYCPNKCGAFPRRKDVDGHVNQVCPLTVIDCDFSYAGCEVRLPRGEVATHLKDDMVKHFSLLAISHKKQQKDLKGQRELLNAQQVEIEDLKRQMKTSKQQQNTSIAEKDKDIRALNEKVEKLRKQTKILRSQTTTFPVEFYIYNPETCKTQISNPFYSHHEGYKMRLQFYYEASLLHLGLCLMKGEYDDQLEWPLTATVKIFVLDYDTNVLHFNFNLSIKNGQRIQEEGHAEKHASCALTNSTHIKAYARRGTMIFRVIGVQL